MRAKNHLRAPVDRAIEILGGQQALADVAGVKYQAVQQWKKVPDKRLAKVSRATGMKMSELRPDIFDEKVAA